MKIQKIEQVLECLTPLYRFFNFNEYGKKNHQYYNVICLNATSIKQKLLESNQLFCISRFVIFRRDNIHYIFIEDGEIFCYYGESYLERKKEINDLYKRFGHYKMVFEYLSL